jgi:hypothetical protein
VNDFKKGFGALVVGVISSVTISAVLHSFAQDGLIPSYMVFLFTVCGFLGAVLLMASFATSGVIFTIGWILGALALKDMLTTFDFVVYLVAPIVVLAARTVVYLYSRNFDG